MEKPRDPVVARVILLLIGGIALNTLGIVLTGIGAARFVLMAVGLGMILAFRIALLRNQRASNSSDEP